MSLALQARIQRLEEALNGLKEALAENDATQLAALEKRVAALEAKPKRGRPKKEKPDG